jgi:uncharacterized protein YceK
MNITRHTFIALTVLALAGCASVGDLQGKGAAEVFTSRQSAMTVNECITEGWNNIKVAGSPTSIRQQRVGGTLRVINGPSSVLEMADITAANNGSSVKFYRANGLANWRERHFTDAIRSCI